MKTKSSKKTILLVFPRNYFVNYVDFSGAVSSITGKLGGAAPASLATIAALTPPEFDVTIIDENLEEIDFDRHYDIVGITGFITQIPRAKAIAGEFSRRGVLVVCGGASVSISPERWRHFSDVLIIGEAERIWPRFLRDYLAGAFSREYKETERFDLSISPVPDYSRYSRRSLNEYMWGIVQTSRGCPFNCDFCNVIVYAGRKMRYKPAGNVIREIDQLAGLYNPRVIFLADDNFSAGRKEAKNILAAIRDWNRKQKRPVTFITQLSIDIAKDEEFLLLASEAGLTTVIIGIETPNVESLSEAGKTQNINTDMLADIKKFHEYGIIVVCGCMIGFDSDDLSIFRKQFEFHEQTGIPNVQVYPLQAFDATPFKERMVKEGRYVDFETTLSAGKNELNVLDTQTIIPKQMTPEQLRQGAAWLLWRLYDPENFSARYGMFLDNYERSEKRNSLKLLKESFDREGLFLFFRLITYVLIKGSSNEKKAFWKMLRSTLKSSHPQKFTLFASCFLTLITTYDIMCKADINMKGVDYPE